MSNNGHKRRVERLENGLQPSGADVWVWAEVGPDQYVCDDYEPPEDRPWRSGPGGAIRQSLSAIEALADANARRYHLVLRQSAVAIVAGYDWLLSRDLAATFHWTECRDNLHVGEASP